MGFFRLLTRLFESINAERARLALPALEWSDTLHQTASDHAAAMAAAGRAVHVLTPGETPRARLSRAGVRTRRFFENVAMAPSVDRAHAELWASPSHRRALIDGLVTHVGVGVSRVDAPDGPVLYITEHLAYR